MDKQRTHLWFFGAILLASLAGCGREESPPAPGHEIPKQDSPPPGQVTMLQFPHRSPDQAQLRFVARS